MNENKMGIIKEEEYNNITDIDLTDDNKYIIHKIENTEIENTDTTIKENIKSGDFDYTLLKILVALMFL